MIYARIAISNGTPFIQSRDTPFKDALPFEVDSEDFLGIRNGEIRVLGLVEATARKRARAIENRRALINGFLETEASRILIQVGGPQAEAQLRAYYEAKYPPPPANITIPTGKSRTGFPNGQK